MKILIVCPELSALESGLSTTARRWRLIMNELGHEVQVISPNEEAQDVDLFIVLNPIRSMDFLRKTSRILCRRVICFTGTDINEHMKQNMQSFDAVSSADILIGLHPGIASLLPESQLDKLRIILQSAPHCEARRPTSKPNGTAVFVANVRDVKCPMTVYLASAAINPRVNVTITHIGEIVDPAYHFWPQINCVAPSPRFRWLGAKPLAETVSLISESDLLIIASRSEGGSNVISEAATLRIPILASMNECAEALLGNDYHGYFPVGNHWRLAKLIDKFYLNKSFRELLQSQIDEIRWKFSYEREVSEWREVLAAIKLL